MMELYVPPHIYIDIISVSLKILILVIWSISRFTSA